MIVRFRNEDCTVHKMMYSNGRIALRLLTKNYEIMAVATVNLPEVLMDKDEVAIKDYSENSGMLKVLQDAGIVGKPFRYEDSGHVKIPICKLLIKHEDL